MFTEIDGRRTAAEIKTNLTGRVNKLKAQDIQPGLGTLLVGEDLGSMKYVAGRHTGCQEVGITLIKKELPADANFDDIAAAIRELNEDLTCTGFVVQLSLPKGTNENAIVDMIDPARGVDGMHPHNLGELVLHVRGDISAPLPCTPCGVLKLLDTYNIDLNDEEVYVLGRGITIGRTISLVLTRSATNTTVTPCYIGTRDMADHMRRADVTVAAMGSAGFITSGRIKDGTVPVDVSVSRAYNKEAGRYRIEGDMGKACYDKASICTPNPGGVGPMIRAMFLANVVKMAERHA